MADEVSKTETIGEEGLIASLTAALPPRTHRVLLDIAPTALIKVLLAVASVWLLIRIFPVLILVLFALMLVATFNPLVRKLQARLGRTWAIAFLVLGVVGLFVGILAFILPPLIHQALNLFLHAPAYTHTLEQMLARHHIHVKVQQRVEQVVSSYSSASPQAVDVLKSAVNGITAFVTVGILTVYLLIEGPQVGLSLMRLLPRKERLHARKLVMEIGAQVGGYMRGQLITSALAGGFSFITLWLLGVPEAFALGALAAIADAIPLIGLLIALLPAVLMALTLSPAKAGIVIAVYIIYHQLESHLIGPKVYGNTLGLSLSVIVISLLIGIELMGIVGAFLALPVAAAIPCIVTYLQEWQESRNPPETTPSLP
ncbi:MAG TPA: AI-2E family transporter [Chthonomonadaceae bacterium]|nr:AI-2E family transporter [Chthonomonadaceae bacterium]